MGISRITELSLYKELKIELQICQIGGLFLGLYHDENIIDTVINHLKRDLSEQFVLPLQITPQKVGFPTFFEQSFEHTGKKSNIFHVIGIETLSEKLQSNFIAYLQYTRERFKAKPYSIVFWITPQFRKQLFLSAPDFYHWISGTYDFSEIRVNTELLEEAELSQSQQVSLENITTYLKKVIWQYEHWQEVKDKGEEFLIDVMERANLYEYYVQTYCIDKNGRTKLLDDILEEFLADNTRNFLTLLGDFGTGKSSFSLHYFIQLAKRYLQNGEGRIPIFISLRNYPGKINIEDFIVREFYEKFNIELSFNIFQELALQGKFIFFVDGFDEMASVSDRELTEENLKELTKLSFENIFFMMNSCKKTQKANKVFLTCRTHYFFTEVQEKKILKSSHTVLYRDYATKTNYEITRIKLKEFNDKQIEEYVFKSTKDKETTRNILGIIKDTYNLQELSTRPLLLEMIVKTLPSLENKKEVNASNLYKAYTEMWINRDDWRSHMKPEGKRTFMWELALKMFNKSGDFSLHYSALGKPNEEFLKQDFQCEERYDDYYKYETTTCTFLNRDQEGNYRFIHKSFMEYFVAEYLFSSFITFSSKKQAYKRYESYYDLKEALNQEMLFFLSQFILTYGKPLEKLDLSYLILSNFDLHNINLPKANLSYADLQGANLQGANLQGANLQEANLQGANLQGANLREVNIEKADLQWADLQEADLQEANLKDAFIEGGYLKRANLEGCDLENVNLGDAYLIETNLEGANLKNAILEGANLSNSNLFEADLSDTKLYGADLVGSNLFGVNLSFSDLSNANLSRTNLSESNLIDAQLLQTDLSRADLSKASLIGVELSPSTNLSDAILFDCEFSLDTLSWRDDLVWENLEWDLSWKTIIGDCVVDEDDINKHFYLTGYPMQVFIIRKLRYGEGWEGTEWRENEWKDDFVMANLTCFPEWEDENWEDEKEGDNRLENIK